MNTNSKRYYELNFNNKSEILAYVQRSNFPRLYKQKIGELMSGNLNARQIIYLKTLCKLPFKSASFPNRSTEEIMNILNQYQYGMWEVKEQIQDYLMLLQKRIKNLSMPVICLNGPPGTGKTSLAYAISKALNRPFVKASLGGVDDTLSIIGCEFSYNNSEPGTIIREIIQSKVNNSVFLIDEIDKLITTHGDPASALLSVLDSTQNKMFEDQYIGLPYDLSKVIFICTSNDASKIPEALRDRLQVIDIEPYTYQDKIEIMKNYSFPKFIKKYELSHLEILIGDKDINYVIKAYTSEQGVRELERLFETIFKKIAIQDNGEEQKIMINKTMISNFLGEEKYSISEYKPSNEVIGTVISFLKTENGIDVPARIETVIFPGKNEMKVSGFYNDLIAKSGADMLMSFLKTYRKMFGIEETMLYLCDIQVNITGLILCYSQESLAAIFVSMLSSILNKCLFSTTMIIGGFTLNGKVFKVYDLKRKLLMIDRIPVKKLILPLGNKSEYEKNKNILSDDIEVIFVDNVFELVEASFEEDVNLNKKDELKSLYLA